MAILYTDIDESLCRWIAALVEEGRLPRGEVLCADVRELRADRLAEFRRVHLFAGIAGWEVALGLVGWPDDLEVWSASCPCQPFSMAGRKKGDEDERHLWPSVRELVAKCRPPVLFGEQVASPLGRAWLSTVRAELEYLGYAVGAADLPAAGVGAPHIRQRLWWGAVRVADVAVVADAFRNRRGWTGTVADAPGVGQERRGEARYGWSGPADGGDVVGDADRDRRSDPSVHVQRWGPEQAVPDADGTGLSEGDAAFPPPGAGGEDGEWPAWTRGPGWLAEAEWWPGPDGVARPFERGIHPVADGLPTRVVAVRAAGNSIVPQLAAKFVESFAEAVVVWADRR